MDIFIRIPETARFPEIRKNSFYDDDPEEWDVHPPKPAEGFFQSPNYSYGSYGGPNPNREKKEDK